MCVKCKQQKSEEVWVIFITMIGNYYWGYGNNYRHKIRTYNVYYPDFFNIAVHNLLQMYLGVIQMY